MSDRLNGVWALAAAVAVGVAGGTFAFCMAQKANAAKLVNVRLIGQQSGLAVAARRWEDIYAVFPPPQRQGQEPEARRRVYLADGDEIPPPCLTPATFELLRPGEVIYVAPDGEDYVSLTTSRFVEQRQLAEVSRMFLKMVEQSFVHVSDHFKGVKFDEINEDTLKQVVADCCNKWMAVNQQCGRVFADLNFNMRQGN